MVGRVWPRHGHHGRPLNSVVRHHVKRSSTVWALVPALGFAAVWLLITSIIFAKHDLNGLLLLAIFTVPSSTIVAAIASAATDQSAKTIVSLVGFLIFGMLQYGIIGYVVGLIWRSIAKLMRRDA